MASRGATKRTAATCGSTPGRIPETRSPCSLELQPGCPCNAYAQITARCSSNHNHAFALYLSVASTGDRIKGACYSQGSGKVQNESSSREVEAAVRLFCTYLSGRRMQEVRGAQLADILMVAGDDPVVLDSVDLSSTRSEEGARELRGAVGDRAFSLLVGGAIPFVLFNWALLNFEIKRAIHRVLGIGPGDVIRFGRLEDMYSLLDELRKNPFLVHWGRSLELGVRALHLNTVDESSMRSAYQRATYTQFLAEAQRRGFLADFQVV